MPKFAFVALVALGFVYAAHASDQEVPISPPDAPIACVAALTTAGDDARAPQPFTEEFFEAAREKVLATLVGQRRAINQFFDNFKGWYLTPSQDRERPAVILLAGMTATGKTTIPVLALEALGLLPETFYFHLEKFSSPNLPEHAFSKDLYRYVSGRQEPLDIEGFESELTTVRKPENAVIILDEAQKLNTLNSEGKPNDRPTATEIFEFLGNNGKIKMRNPAYDELKSAANSPYFYMETPDDWKDLPDQEKRTWKKNARERVEQALKTMPTQIDLDFSSSAVLVMMNLDNVYTKSASSNPESTTADESHDETARISATDIRAGLLELFRPEHVRRLGSRYISFPTFSNTEFRQMMDRKLTEIRERALRKYGLNIEFTKGLIERIYHEGVIPTQGMVPLIDTIVLFASDPLPTMSARYREATAAKKKVDILVDVDPADGDHSRWIATVDGEVQPVEKFFIPSDWANSLNLREEPLRSHVAVRLAARVAAGIEAFDTFPDFVRANTRVTGRDGIVQFPGAALSDDYKMRSKIRAKLAYHLAPTVMEQLVFGESSMMSASNLASASAYAKILVTQGMTRDELTHLIVDPVEKPKSPKADAKDPKSLGGEALQLTSATREMISSLKEMMSLSAALHNNPSHLLLTGDRPGIESDAEGLLREGFKITNAFLRKQRKFIAALASRLAQSVEIKNIEIRQIYEIEWEGERTVGRVEPTRAQLFLQDPENFEFHVPRPPAAEAPAESKEMEATTATNVVPFKPKPR